MMLAPGITRFCVRAYGETARTRFHQASIGRTIVPSYRSVRRSSGLGEVCRLKRLTS
jgi:hypothetical protein